MFRKEVATETSKRSCLRTPFGNQSVNGFQTPLEVARHHYYPFFPWISGKLSWKKTVLLWIKILILFVNTLTADDKYSCRNMQNFLQQLQTLLSQKRKTLSGFFIAFLKCSWNSQHSEKKDECPSLFIPKLLFRKQVLTETSRRCCFRTPFGNQRVNGFQAPLKVGRHHYYPFSHEFQVNWVGKTLLYSDHQS